MRSSTVIVVVVIRTQHLVIIAPEVVIVVLAVTHRYTYHMYVECQGEVIVGTNYSPRGGKCS